MARLTAFAMAASILCADIARAQPQASVQDLGNGIHAAIGVAVGTGGGTDARRVAVPQIETYGKISWSVRGIYEGYAGWFDGNPASMFGTPAAAYDEIVRMAGGPARVAARARELARTDPVRALFLADMALAADPRDVAGLETRLEILKILDRQSANSNERGWIRAGIRDAESRLKR